MAPSPSINQRLWGQFSPKAPSIQLNSRGRKILSAVKRKGVSGWKSVGLDNRGAAIDREHLPGGDRGFVGGEIDRHLRNMDRQAEAVQMRGGELADVLGAFHQFLDAL